MVRFANESRVHLDCRGRFEGSQLEDEQILASGCFCLNVLDSPEGFAHKAGMEKVLVGPQLV